ncbi:MAG: AraC family transcriptional regulator [Gemmatimonadaceae bacterium]|nr:AraC family transcriptional regulator [Gemmatimonadaceae bacterium]
MVSEILASAHLTTSMYGRMDLGAPWRIGLPASGTLSFYVVARGGGWVQVAGTIPEGPHGPAQPYPPVALSAGDILLLPRGQAHWLVDHPSTKTAPLELDHQACPRPWIGDHAVFGGDGPVTSLVIGHFRFGGSAAGNPLLGTFPAILHIPASAAVPGSPLAGIMPLILGESAAPGPGSNIVLARLADLLLIHALRYWIANAGAHTCGLHAVVNPNIGRALRLIHARPAESWTVDSLAQSVDMSRSAFSALFTRLVGEPPLMYVTRWRMTQAALRLEASEESVATVAEHVGYANPVAFAKAFTRVQGVGPGAWRRQHRTTAP